MALAFLGILCNLLVVTTIRHQVIIILKFAADGKTLGGATELDNQPASYQPLFLKPLGLLFGK